MDNEQSNLPNPSNKPAKKSFFVSIINRFIKEAWELQFIKWPAVGLNALIGVGIGILFNTLMSTQSDPTDTAIIFAMCEIYRQKGFQLFKNPLVFIFGVIVVSNILIVIKNVTFGSLMSMF